MVLFFLRRQRIDLALGPHLLELRIGARGCELTARHELIPDRDRPAHRATHARLALIKAGATSQQIDLAKARVQQAQAALDEATLAAPFDGSIAEVTINPGEIAVPGMRLISLADVAQWEVDTDDLTEKDVVGVQPGAPVNITLDALPGVTLKGQVMSITPRSTTKSGDVTYTVKISIADPDPRLRWGMTASVNILDK